MERKLQEDFPIDWEEDHYVSRREFLKFMALASGGLAVGSAALAVWSRVPRSEREFEPARIAGLNDLQPGSSMQFSFPRQQDMCVLIHLKDGRFVAYSRRCTHLSCPVEYEPSQGRLYCPCHNGAFALEDGRVLQGPPARPLPEIALQIRGDDVYAVGVKLRDNA